MTLSNDRTIAHVLHKWTKLTKFLRIKSVTLLSYIIIKLQKINKKKLNEQKKKEKIATKIFIKYCNNCCCFLLADAVNRVVLAFAPCAVCRIFHDKKAKASGIHEWNKIERKRKSVSTRRICFGWIHWKCFLVCVWSTRLVARDDNITIKTFFFFFYFPFSTRAKISRRSRVALRLDLSFELKYIHKQTKDIHENTAKKEKEKEKRTN